MSSEELPSDGEGAMTAAASDDGDTALDEGGDAFRPRLDSYNGPLDLLLFLIKKDEIDIFDIPIARVVDQYSTYLAVIREIDPNACGEFLVLCAQLIEIKSKLLLPKPELEEDEEELEDPRLELVRQLLEFKKYKERAFLLERRFEEFQRRYRRPHVPIPESEIDFAVPLSLGDVSVWDLLAAFQRIELALGQRGPHRVVLRDRPLREYMVTIEEILLDGERRAPLDRLFERAVDRYDAIGYLLAILEMAKAYRIRLEEADPGELIVHLRTDAEVEEYARSLDAAADEVDPAEAQLLRGEGEEARSEPVDVQAEGVATSEVPQVLPEDIDDDTESSDGLGKSRLPPEDEA